MLRLLENNDFLILSFNNIKRRYAIIICAIISMFFLYGTSYVYAEKENSDERNEFGTALEKQLVDNMHYYDPKSANVIDSLVTNVHVKKILTVDDPNTPENEEVIEEYDTPLVVGFVNAKQRRDSFFLFDNTDIYYYAQEKKEFVDYSQIIGNKELIDFYQKYSEQKYKKITPLSFTILMLMIFLVIIIPFFIMIFHNKWRSTSSVIGNQYHDNQARNTDLKY